MITAEISQVGRNRWAVCQDISKVITESSLITSISAILLSFLKASQCLHSVCSGDPSVSFYSVAKVVCRAHVVRAKVPTALPAVHPELSVYPGKYPLGTASLWTNFYFCPHLYGTGGNQVRCQKRV